jgi:transcriptional regulator with XRE-family HTH domain
MDPAKRKRLEDAGFKFGTVGELFQLDRADEEMIEMKVALAASVRDLRGRKRISQAALAKQLESGQARVSKIERADPSVSLDLLVRAALVLGATPDQVARAMTAGKIAGGATARRSVAVSGPKREPADRPRRRGAATASRR